LNGTRILKFYLHISPEEQFDRFRQRLDDKSRHWKISESDYSERKLWPEYIEAYEDALTLTSTKRAPWYVIPANHKWLRNLQGLVALTYVLTAFFIADGILVIILAIAHRRELSGKWEWMMVNGVIDLILARGNHRGLSGHARLGIWPSRGHRYVVWGCLTHRDGAASTQRGPYMTVRFGRNAPCF
jgi:hypothetical protein